MQNTNRIWYVVDGETRRPISQLPMSITAASFHIKTSRGLTLDTINGGGSGWLAYPNDGITQLSHKLMENSL